ncbi:MAG: hypothetical protein ACHQ4H_18335 [Ktedonobacterales bacterium]
MSSVPRPLAVCALVAVCTLVAHRDGVTRPTRRSALRIRYK